MFSHELGTYEICEVCGWEDDPVQLQHPLMSGGANHSSLWESQKKLLKRLPPEIQQYAGHMRDPDWRALLDGELRSENMPSDGESYFHAIPNEAPRKYWKKYS